MIGVSAHADSSSLNLQLPGTGGNYQSDKFRAGELIALTQLDQQQT